MAACSGFAAFRIAVPAAGEDDATAVLWEAGTLGVEVRASNPGQVELLAYFPAPGPDLTSRLSTLAATVEPVPVPELDWVARVRESFQPIAVGSFLVAPPWRIPTRRALEGRLLLVDPGRAFGTGSHETTRLCLGRLEALAAERPLGRVLDVGTGSGILAVAACLLGAAAVVASDLDPEALRAARAQARLNRCEISLVRADCAAPFARGTFDVVVANLTAALLREHCGELLAARAPSGALVLSGLLADEAAAFERSCRPHGRVELRREQEWAALVVRGRRG